jgi:hypothetical protein
MTSAQFRVPRPLCLFAAAVATATAPAAAQRAPAPDYAAYTRTAFIPFANARSNVPPFTVAPELEFWVAGKKFRPTMDTGTTGIMLSALSIPGYTPELAARYPRGSEYLSSSKHLWVGHWIPQQVAFRDPRGLQVVASVPVLAVDSEVICPGYYDTIPRHAATACPGRPLRPAGDSIVYMGVGFGRESDGQPEGTPDKNPFLNIVRIGDRQVQQGTLRAGYVVTDTGVHVGLTAANTAGFAFTRLAPVPHRTDARDWSGASVCVAVDGSPCARGSALIDIGIPQMYLTVTPQVPVTRDSARDLSRPCVSVPVLRNGSTVTVAFPDSLQSIASYTFVVGDSANPVAPAQVISNPDRDSAFVNTGRHFFRNFNVLFDADSGYFGLRRAPGASRARPQTGLRPPGLRVRPATPTSPAACGVRVMAPRERRPSGSLSNRAR